MGEMSFKSAVLRGLRRHCPSCDSPTLFTGYLKVRARCPVCAADNGQYRVDDIASYFTVLLVGHIVLAPLLAVPALWTLPLWASVPLVMALVAMMTLVGLPFIKGGVVGALASTGQKPPADARR